MARVSKLFVFILFLISLAYIGIQGLGVYRHSLPVFALLIPKASEKSLEAEMWMRSGSEEGVPIGVVIEEDLITPFEIRQAPPQVILVPDQIAPTASATLVAYLHEYVLQGGKLVLVGDALMNDLNGRMKESLPLETYFHFPELTGREGDTLQMVSGDMLISDAWIDALEIPPGQYLPPRPKKAELRAFCTYQTAHPDYPHYVNSPKAFAGKTILTAEDGSLLAGINSLGSGEVMWINLPLSYLKRRTNGLIMHSFLHYISETWAGLPRLLSVPNGVGGLVLNVHVDSNAALPYLRKMRELGIFEQGPFSIHVTAGPDTREEHDGLGFDVNHNPEARDWIHYWLKRGDEVGSHGGWIHDYFGLHLSDKRTPEFEGDLEKNFEAISKAAKHAPTEYSAPLGNHPIWVNDWLRKAGYHSYYFVGDNGMGPTQNFRDNVFTDQDLWSFPVAAYGQAASFEEAGDQHIPAVEMGLFMSSLSHYVSEYETSRLFYFHPPGIAFYTATLTKWMKENAALVKAKKFKWYTMEQLTKFLTRRDAVSWRVDRLNTSGDFELSASGHVDLHQMTWKFLKDTNPKIQVISGKIKTHENETEMFIQSETDQAFTVRFHSEGHRLQ